jgi:hypothetical protein
MIAHPVGHIFFLRRAKEPGTVIVTEVTVLQDKVLNIDRVYCDPVSVDIQVSYRYLFAVPDDDCDPAETVGPVGIHPAAQCSVVKIHRDVIAFNKNYG